MQKYSKFANMRKNWTIAYYNERVKRDVFAFPAGVLADYLRLLDLMQEFGADLRMPHSRAMGGGLFELRPKGREGIGRVFYCTHVGRQVVVLHSFVKKTQETPQHELRIAQARLKEVRNG
ncbi:type II toxin-antitoxin system RelE/ParE family toxin [Burkholderia pseudomallei]|nr:type II toxin-antitoxin system RelE/ParE family toxin [Burkholderia pseudomallei]MWA23339.1 type II toxin-antitoxin system RelE/ParE family toxin [Burkholderia pseudomallei]PJO60815.1 type II toxin-antitoxin system RelE/ParE family toxin [Burkholderia pseudomallei]